MERSTIFHGKTHDFNGHVQVRKLKSSLPEGTLSDIPQGEHVHVKHP